MFCCLEEDDDHEMIPEINKWIERNITPDPWWFGCIIIKKGDMHLFSSRDVVTVVDYDLYQVYNKTTFCGEIYPWWSCWSDDEDGDGDDDDDVEWWSRCCSWIIIIRSFFLQFSQAKKERKERDFLHLFVIRRKEPLIIPCLSWPEPRSASMQQSSSSSPPRCSFLGRCEKWGGREFIFSSTRGPPHLIFFSLLLHWIDFFLPSPLFSSLLFFG